MRITNKMMSDNFLSDMRLNLENLNKIQQQSTSGKEIRIPSDDPFRAVRAMQLHTDIATNKQYNENISDTVNWLNETDTALGQLGSQMTRIRELLLSAGNPGYGASERQKIKDEINQIVGTISQVLNSNFDGKYIFGGTRGTTKPSALVTKSEIRDLKVPKGNKVEISGDYSGEVNTSYIIEKVATDKKVKISSDGGSTFITKDIEADGTVNIGNGLTLKINEMKDGTKVTFNCKAPENARLGFNGKDDKEMNLSRFEVKETDIENWNGKFNINGIDIKIENLSKPDSTGKSGSTIDDLIEKINSQLGGKNIKATSVITDGKKYVEFVSDDDSQINIEEVVQKDASGKEKKEALPKSLQGLKENKQQIDIVGEKLITEISQGVNIEYNVTAKEIMNFTNAKGEAKDLANILNRIVKHLDSKDPEEVKQLYNQDLVEIDDITNNVLKLRSQVGSKQNRMEAAEKRNTRENFDMTAILSKTEDIDLTEKSMEFATMLSVYTASLQVSARVIQPTLVDYLR